MTGYPLRPGVLQRLPSFSGVLILLGLLASFPWLPIASGEPSFTTSGPLPVSTINASRISNADLAAGSAPDLSGIPAPEMSEAFTLHVAGSREQYEAVLAMYPEPLTDSIMIAQPGENIVLLRVRREMDAERERLGLPRVQVDDQRTVP